MYNYPPGCEPETQYLLQEFELIRRIVPKNAVLSMFQTKSWQNRWVRSKGKTFSLESGINFGHYIAGVKSYIIPRYHAIKNTIALNANLPSISGQEVFLL